MYCCFYSRIGVYRVASLFLSQLETLEANDVAVLEEGQKHSVEQQWGRLSRPQPLSYPHQNLRGPATVNFSLHQGGNHIEFLHPRSRGTILQRIIPIISMAYERHHVET